MGSSKSKLNEGMSFTDTQANLIDIESDCSPLRNVGENANKSVECTSKVIGVYSLSTEISNKATVMKIELVTEPLMTELMNN